MDVMSYSSVRVDDCQSGIGVPFTHNFTHEHETSAKTPHLSMKHTCGHQDQWGQMWRRHVPEHVASLEDTKEMSSFVGVKGLSKIK